MYWLNMLETISISASAAAIFSAEEGCGRPPPKRKDMVAGCGESIGRVVSRVRDVGFKVAVGVDALCFDGYTV